MEILLKNLDFGFFLKAIKIRLPWAPIPTHSPELRPFLQLVTGLWFALLLPSLLPQLLSWESEALRLQMKVTGMSSQNERVMENCDCQEQSRGLEGYVDVPVIKVRC